MILGLNIFIIRLSHANENTNKLNNNVVCDRQGLQNKIKELAKKNKAINKDICIILCKEFRDGFLCCKSSTANDSLLLHNFVLSLNDSTIDNSICVCP